MRRVAIDPFSISHTCTDTWVITLAFYWILSSYIASVIIVSISDCMLSLSSFVRRNVTLLDHQKITHFSDTLWWLLFYSENSFTYRGSISSNRKCTYGNLLFLSLFHQTSPCSFLYFYYWTLCTLPGILFEILQHMVTLINW